MGLQRLPDLFRIYKLHRLHTEQAVPLKYRDLLSAAGQFLSSLLFLGEPAPVEIDGHRVGARIVRGSPQHDILAAERHRYRRGQALSRCLRKAQ